MTSSVRRYRVTAPDGAEVVVEAHGPHRAAVEAAAVLGQDGLVTFPDGWDGTRPRWSVRLAGWDYPRWLVVIR
jgi:hypothetical protein